MVLAGVLGVLALPGLPPRAPGVVPAELPAGAARLLYGVPLDLNGAPAEALEALPGVGPARAAAIAQARGERPFCAVAEVVRVHGIGPVTLARIADQVAVDPPAGCAAGPPAR